MFKVRCIGKDLCDFFIRGGLVLVLSFIFYVSGAQTISQAEYFFDVDPGPGNGTPISFAPGDPVTFTKTIPTTGLSYGYHRLFVRTQTSTGDWSLFEPREFFIDGGIVAAEYFFDVDPGPGNGTALAPADPINFTETISTTGLSPGHHILFVRTQASSGEWSLYQPQEFFIDGGILGGEYFFDRDPGVGNGTRLRISPDTHSFTERISAASLADGPHLLFVRTRHDVDRWSLSQPQLFYIQTRIVAAEYFIDADPGSGNGTSIAIGTPSDLVRIDATLTTTSLPDGDHYLFIRTMDIHGQWSLFEPELFQVDALLPIELLDFKATATQDGRVRLQWTTLTEINNDLFTLQHLTEGEEFEEIAKVPGAGTSTKAIDYEVIHLDPSMGTNYYRLKQTDFDGNFTLSKVVSASVETEANTLVYPNPATDNWFVKFSKEEDHEPKLLEVFDLTGRKLVEYKTHGEQVVGFIRQGLPNGTYVLKITSADKGFDFYKINLH